MKLTVRYRYIDDIMVPVMYFPFQRMGVEIYSEPTEHNVKMAIINALDTLDMKPERISELEYKETP